MMNNLHAQKITDRLIENSKDYCNRRMDEIIRQKDLKKRFPIEYPVTVNEQELLDILNKIRTEEYIVESLYKLQMIVELSKGACYQFFMDNNGLAILKGVIEKCFVEKKDFMNSAAALAILFEFTRHNKQSIAGFLFSDLVKYLSDNIYYTPDTVLMDSVCFLKSIVYNLHYVPDVMKTNEYKEIIYNLIRYLNSLRNEGFSKKRIYEDMYDILFYFSTKEHYDPYYDPPLIHLLQQVTNESLLIPSYLRSAANMVHLADNLKALDFITDYGFKTLCLTIEDVENEQTYATLQVVCSIIPGIRNNPQHFIYHSRFMKRLAKNMKVRFNQLKKGFNCGLNIPIGIPLTDEEKRDVHKIVVNNGNGRVFTINEFWEYFVIFRENICAVRNDEAKRAELYKQFIDLEIIHYSIEVLDAMNKWEVFYPIYFFSAFTTDVIEMDYNLFSKEKLINYFAFCIGSKQVERSALEELLEFICYLVQYDIGHNNSAKFGLFKTNQMREALLSYFNDGDNVSLLCQKLFGTLWPEQNGLYHF